MRPSIGFQSTHPCGVRPSTYFISLNGFSFNPRTRVGCDNPKAKFDLLFGYETFWQRLEGVELLAVKDSDPQINAAKRYIGKTGDVIADTTSPDQYRGYTQYLWVRVDGAKPPVKYDGQYSYDGSAQYQ